jgi:hypothetical protein
VKSGANGVSSESPILESFAAWRNFPLLLLPHCDFMAFVKDDNAFLLFWLHRVGGSTSIASSFNNRIPGFSMYPSLIGNELALFLFLIAWMTLVI